MSRCPKDDLSREAVTESGWSHMYLIQYMCVVLILVDTSGISDFYQQCPE